MLTGLPRRVRMRFNSGKTVDPLRYSGRFRILTGNFGFHCNYQGFAAVFQIQPII